MAAKAKVRQDSWAAPLSEEAAWSLYYRARQTHWSLAAEWAAREFNLPAVPSRTSFYAWLKQMGEAEHEHNMAQAILAQHHARTLAKDYRITDEESVKALMATATDAALVAHDAELAKTLFQTALQIRDRQQKAEDLKLKERAQSVKEKDLEISMRRLALLEAKHKEAEKTLAQKSLTPEEREQKLREIFGL